MMQLQVTYLVAADRYFLQGIISSNGVCIVIRFRKPKCILYASLFTGIHAVYVRKYC